MKNKLFLAALLITPLAGLLFSTLSFQSGYSPKETTNNGTFFQEHFDVTDLNLQTTSGNLTFEDGKWICEPYYPYTNFYSNFGNYRANITIPSKMKIGSTGVIVSNEEKDSLTSYTFAQDAIHDFAWFVTDNSDFVDLNSIFLINISFRIERLFKSL